MVLVWKVIYWGLIRELIGMEINNVITIEVEKMIVEDKNALFKVSMAWKNISVS